VGLELAAFASTASGRFRAPDAPVDRLALDGLGVLRPFVRRFDVLDSRYAARVARTLALEGGVGLERDSRGVRSGSRVGVHTGGRIEFPLTPAGPGSQLRVRLAARRLVGLYRPRVGDLEVGDSTELYLALATVF
jgi:hypothetical protein